MYYLRAGFLIFRWSDSSLELSADRRSLRPGGHVSGQISLPETLYTGIRSALPRLRTRECNSNCSRLWTSVISLLFHFEEGHRFLVLSSCPRTAFAHLSPVDSEDHLSEKRTSRPGGSPLLKISEH